MTGNGRLFIGGRWLETDERIEVRNKFGGDVVAEVGRASPQLTSLAVELAAEAFTKHSLRAYDRHEILMRAVGLLAERRDELITTMVAESGFTVNDCTTEFTRALQTLTISAEEAKRVTGEMVPIDGAPGQDPRRLAFTLRMPVGVVCAITPFNSPLNTVLHKIAPALAAGNSVVLKPATYTPITAIVLCEVLEQAGVPAGFLNLVIGGGADVGKQLLEDQRVRFYTFTGSTEVGRIIQQHAGLRRTQLELGNISATIVCDDATLELAAEKCVSASFRKAGQVCTSVQRVLVDKGVIDQFTEIVAERTSKLVVGDPALPGTFVGPMIDEREAVRAQSWIDEAVSAGAKPLTGAARTGATVQPTVLTGAGPEMKVVNQEIFAPVVSLCPVADLDEAVRLANATPFGLSGGVFTNDVTRALGVIRRLDLGSIHINDTSSSRVDLMPYGGIKDSGFGQEGPKYAIRDMTEERLVTINPVG